MELQKLYSIFRQVSGDIWENSVVAFYKKISKLALPTLIKIAKFVANFGNFKRTSQTACEKFCETYSMNRVFRISSSSKTYHFRYSNRVVSDFATCMEGIHVWFFLLLFSLPQSLGILTAARSETICGPCLCYVL